MSRCSEDFTNGVRILHERRVMGMATCGLETYGSELPELSPVWAR